MERTLCAFLTRHLPWAYDGYRLLDAVHLASCRIGATSRLLPLRVLRLDRPELLC